MIRAVTRLRRGEGGTSLILALVFLSLFGVAMVALLGFSSSSTQSQIAVHTLGATAYGAESGAQGALNAIRTAIAQGTEGGACTTFTTTVNGVAIEVQCSGLSGSGLKNVGANQYNVPFCSTAIWCRAMVSLNTSNKEIGIWIDKGTTVARTFRVHGGVYSDSTALPGAVDLNSISIKQKKIKNITFQVEGLATGAAGLEPPAQGGPSPTRYGLLAARKACYSATTQGDYIKAYDFVNLSFLATSHCLTANPNITDPGYYTIVASIPSGGGVCADNNTNLGVGCLKPVGSATHPCPANQVYDINPGTYTGDATEFTKLLSGTYFTSGACANTATTSPIFWFHPGAYYFHFTSGSHEININDLADSTHFGASYVAGKPKGTFNPLSVTKPPVPAIASAGGACKTDADYVAGTLTTRALAALEGVQFIFGGDSRLHLTKPGRGFELCAPPIQNEANNALLSQQIAFFDITSNNQATAFAGSNAASGCVTTEPYSSAKKAKGCPVLKIDQPSASVLVNGTATTRAVVGIHGTVYAPPGAVHLLGSNPRATIIDRGIVARTIKLTVDPGSFTGATVSAPDVAVPPVSTDRDVLFTVCTPTCASGVQKLYVEALLHDGGGATPGKSVEIVSWSFRR